MALSQADRNEIKDLLLSCVSGTHARTEAKFEIIDTKLDTINAHLTKMNGKVSRHEDQINEALTERAQNREHQKNFEKEMTSIPNRLEHIETRLDHMEDTILENKVTKKFVLKALSVSGIIISAIVGVVKVVEFFLTN